MEGREEQQRPYFESLDLPPCALARNAAEELNPIKATSDALAQARGLFRVPAGSQPLGQ